MAPLNVHCPVALGAEPTLGRFCEYTAQLRRVCGQRSKLCNTDLYRPRRTLTSPSSSIWGELRHQISEDAQRVKDGLLPHNTITASITGSRSLRPDVPLHLNHAGNLGFLARSSLKAPCRINRTIHRVPCDQWAHPRRRNHLYFVKVCFSTGIK
jgi:hypothetical protein